MKLYEQYKKDIEPIENNINKTYGNFAQLGIDLIKQSYLNVIDVMIETLQTAEDRAFKLWEESHMALDQSVQLHSRNLKRDLIRERKLIEDYE